MNAKFGAILVTQPNQSVAGWAGGTSVLCKAGGAETNGGYAAFELHSPPGTGSPAHVHHREDEAMYVVAGEYEMTDVLTDRVIVVAAGGMMHFPRGAPHAFRNVGPNDAKALIVATPAGLEGFFEEIVSACSEEAASEIAARYGIEFFESSA